MPAVVAAIPDELCRFADESERSLDELLEELRRWLLPVRISFPWFPVPVGPLIDDAIDYAGRTRELEDWVRRIAGAFGRADLGDLVCAGRFLRDRADEIEVLLAGGVAGGRALAGRLADDAVAPTARQIVAAIEEAEDGDDLDRSERRRLREALAPLRARLRTLDPPPEDQAGLLRTLAVPGERPRDANPVVAFLDGLVLGAFDGRGYDGGWAEGSRVLGHLVSGLLVVGDVRDGVADGVNRRWGSLVLDVVSLVPAVGDGVGLARRLARTWPYLRRAGRAADALLECDKVTDSTVMPTVGAG